MPKAVLQNGRIIPVDPLPAEWKEGQEILLEALQLPLAQADDAAAWLREVEEAAATIPPESDACFQEAIRAVRAQAKLQAQRELEAAG